jgi:glyoxylase-like metal-dependent hydrolase (beta-lactamase superfamily II)
VKERLRPDLRVHVAAAEAEFWESPDFSRVSMPPGFPDALRRTGKRFLKEYHGQLRTFENEYEVTPGVVVQRTGGHTPGHSVVRLASGGREAKGDQRPIPEFGPALFRLIVDHVVNLMDALRRSGPRLARA